MLEAISKLPSTSEDWTANVKHLQATFETNQLEGLIRKVMRLKEEQTSTTRMLEMPKRSMETSFERLSLEGAPPTEPGSARSSISSLEGRSRDNSNEGHSSSDESLGSPSSARSVESLAPPFSPPRIALPIPQRPLPPPPHPRQLARPQETTVTSPRGDSLIEAKRPEPLHKSQSFIITSPINLLKSRREYDVYIQGAICIKFLFPAMYHKLFPTDEDKRTVDNLIRTYGMFRFNAASLSRAIDEVFPEAPRNLFSIITLLGKKQTLSRISQLPSAKSFEPLPEIFSTDPRLSDDLLPKLLNLMGYIRYRCLGTYTAMSPDFRRYLNCFCTSVFIKDMIGWPIRDCFQVAFGGKYPSDSEMDQLIREVTLSDDLTPVEIPQPALAPRSITDVYSYPFLRYPILFKQLLKHVALFPPEVRSGSFFTKQIEGVHRLKEQALFSHEAAVQRCFCMGALKREFGSLNDSQIIVASLAQIEKLTPTSSYSHPYLETEEGIDFLIENTQEDLHLYLKRAREVIRQNPGIPPHLAVQVVITKQALRLLFDSDNDYENGKALIKLIDQAGKMKTKKSS
jgi:hypothetical protein